MLFVAIHEHTSETCPLVNAEPLLLLGDEEHIKQSGVKVLGGYAAPPEHTMFFILEADNYSQIVRFFRPMMMIGTPRIIPVQTIQESAEALGVR